MKKIFVTLNLLLFVLFAFAQTPQAFKYQAIIRNGAGELVVDQNVGIQLSILEGSDTGTPVYTETWNVQTNSFGLVTLNVGKGTTSDDFSAVSWGTNLYYLQVAVDVAGGTDYTVMGASQLLSVPYALYSNESGNGSSQWLNNESTIYYNDGNVGVGTSTPSGKLVIKAAPDAASDSVLFEVKDKDGVPLMTITSEGVKIYVKDGTKGVAGGFAVGRYAAAKGDIDTTFLLVTPDSTRVYTAPNSKGIAGGFAVGRYAAAKGGATNKYFFTGVDSTRIYLNENTKGIAGGFAVGRYAAAKGDEVDYFNINTSSIPEVINPSEARIVWYPLKEAFLTGKVLIESPDSVGQNSMATGFESKSIGDFSQALGYQARAFGDNSTAIGNNANAVGVNSYAFGNFATSTSDGSYAIGTGAIATGYKSFALGSRGLSEEGDLLTTVASGEYSYAFGKGAVALGEGSFVLGVQDTAVGMGSMALGFQTLSKGLGSFTMGAYTTAENALDVAMGYNTIASGGGSTAMGSYSQARGNASLAMGDSTYASGDYSTAMGMKSMALGENSTAMGDSTKAVGFASTTMGYRTLATGYNCIAMGDRTVANGDASFAMGSETQANGLFSVSIGGSTIANGDASIAFGQNTIADGNASWATGESTHAEGDASVTFGTNTHAVSTGCVVMGAFNEPYSGTFPYSADSYLLVVGNGYDDSNRHNAITVLKNGNFGVNTNAPDKTFTVEGDARVTGSIFYGAIGSTTEYDKPDFVFEPEYKKDFKISEVEQFIKVNKHLPWVTSAKDEKEGINMTRLSFETLEAIENQQLQIIKLNNELNNKNKTIIELKKELSRMDSRLKEIEETLKLK